MALANEISLEQIAREIAPSVKMVSPEYDKGNHFHFERADDSIKGGGKKQTTSQRFGEVLQAFLEVGTIAGVSKKTGITHYLLNKYFFSDPEFCKLLKGTNEAIFLEATREIRDKQEGFLLKASRLAEDALNEMEALLNESPSETVRFKVAQDLLDRDPRISRTKRVEGSGLKVQIDIKTLQLASLAAREIEPPNEVRVLSIPTTTTKE